MNTMYQDGTYFENNPAWHEADSPWKAKRIRNILLDNGIAHAKLCEVGCGVGGILLNLEEMLPEARLSGYEISPQAFSVANTRGTERTQFYLGDITKAQDPDFDVLMLIDVIEHVDDYMAFMKSLKPIGRYKVLHIPLDLSVQSLVRVSPILNQRRDLGHIHYFFKDLALRALEDCGYKIVDWRYTASRLELPDQALLSRLMKLPRRLLYALSPDLAVRVVGGYSLLVLAE